MKTKNKIKVSGSYKCFTFFNTLVMIGVMIATLYPFLYVFFVSFSDPDAFMAHRGILLKPLNFNIDTYKLVFKDPMIVIGFMNTFKIVVLGVSLSMLLTVIGGYVFSRRDAKLVSPGMLLILFTMYFSGGLIPSYFVVKGLGLIDTTAALILPGAINAYNLIIMRTAFAAVPSAIDDAAKIDGCGHVVTLFRVMLPLVKPTMMVIMLYYTVGFWNAWFSASIYLNTRTKFPLQLVLREILFLNDTSKMTTGVNSADKLGVAETLKYAVMVVSTLPILVVYPFVQRYFTKGVMVGAVKG